MLHFREENAMPFYGLALSPWLQIPLTIVLGLVGVITGITLLGFVIFAGMDTRESIPNGCIGQLKYFFWVGCMGSFVFVLIGGVGWIYKGLLARLNDGPLSPDEAEGSGILAFILATITVVVLIPVLAITITAIIESKRANQRLNAPANETDNLQTPTEQNDSTLNH